MYVATTDHNGSLLVLFQQRLWLHVAWWEKKKKIYRIVYQSTLYFTALRLIHLEKATKMIIQVSTA